MTRNLEIWNELAAISPAVADLGTAMPYAVPVDYFETLSEVIMARVHAGANEETFISSAAGTAMPFEVPQAYFESLSDSILAKVKMQNQHSAADELQILSPLLASISKKNIYAVPEGYFENLAVDVIEKANEKQQAKVVGIFATRTWMRMAAAAAVLVLIAFGVKTWIGSGQKLDSYVKVGLKQYNTESKLNEEMDKLNETDLMNYLQNTSLASDVAIVSALPEEAEVTTGAPVEEDALLESFMNQLDYTTDKTTTETN